MRKILSLAIAALFSATMFAETVTTVYYAVPEATVGTYTVKLNVNYKGDGDDWHTFVMTKTALTHETMDVYKATFTDAYDGLGCLQFQLYDGETWKSEVKVIDWSWTAASVYNGKMWVHGGSTWVDAPAGDVPDVTLYFVNAEDWGGVKAYVYYQDGETHYYKDYPGVEMVSTGKKLKGKDVYSYTFPETYDKIGFVSIDGTKSTSNFAWNKATPYYYEDGDAIASNNWHAKADLIQNVTLYFVNDEDWASVNAYAFGDGIYKAWPGEATTKTEEKANGKDIYSYTFPDNYTTIIFNNGASTQTSDLEYDAAKPYWSQSQREWYASAAAVPAPGDPAKFYITGTAVGGWSPDAVKSTEDSYTIVGLAANTEYQLKITIDGAWGTAKGYDELSEVAEGLSRGTGSDENNIKFTLATAGNVKVTYTESPAVFKLEGNFKATATGINDIENGEKAAKELRNGQLFIIKGEKTYNVLGQEVR